VLQTHYEAVQDALAHHLSAVSRQYALEVAGSLEQCQVKPYRVDGEVGRITFDCYWVEPTNRPDIAPSPFPALHAQEWYRTAGFKEIALAYSTTEESYRQAADLINRVRHQPDATPSRTLRENTEAEGRQVMPSWNIRPRASCRHTGLLPRECLRRGPPTASGRVW